MKLPSIPDVAIIPREFYFYLYIQISSNHFLRIQTLANSGLARDAKLYSCANNCDPTYVCVCVCLCKYIYIYCFIMENNNLKIVIFENA